MSTELLRESTRHDELAVINLIHDVFSTMLDSDAWLDPESTRESYPVIGAVFFAGAWKGAVQVELDEALAYSITAQLMSLETPHSVDSDVCDAVGEVANMIAGNLKSTLPPETVMSMPIVVSGAGFSLTVVGANQLNRMHFATPDGRFAVMLVQTHRN